MGKRDAKKETRVEVRERERDTDRDYRNFPGPRGATARLRIALERGAYGDLTAHAKESLEAEVCGVLVGQACEDDEGPWVHVEAIIRGTAARQGSTHVTFTQETWNIVHEALERDHKGRRIVGWYHTHPGFGVEFSEMDLFIQRNFFPGAEQVAFVTDPLGGAVAICVNTPSGIEYVDRFWVDGREQPARVPEKSTPAADAAGTGAGAGDGASGAAVRALEERVSQLIQAHDDMRALFYRMVMIMGVVFCGAIIGLAVYLILQSNRSRLEPPRMNSFVPIPVQIGDQTVMLGVNVVRWDVPPELEAEFVKTLRAQNESDLKALTEEFKRQFDAYIQQHGGTPPPEAPPSANPATPAPATRP